MKKNTRIQELLIEEEFGIDAIALVEFPAIEVDFLKFSKQKEMVFAKVDNERQVVTGPALIPDKMIFRRDDITREEYYVYFSKETVRKISEKYLIEKNNDSVNIEHEVPVSDISLIESWIIDNPNVDKASHMGFNLPKGTWMVSMRVSNQHVWDKLVKQNLVKGFSIEGNFIEKYSKVLASKTENTYEQIKQIINQIDEE